MPVARPGFQSSRPAEDPNKSVTDVPADREQTSACGELPSSALRLGWALLRPRSVANSLGQSEDFARSSDFRPLRQGERASTSTAR